MGLAPLYHAQFAGCLWIADGEELLVEKAMPRRASIRNRRKIHLLPIAGMKRSSKVYDHTRYYRTCANKHTSREPIGKLNCIPSALENN
jgi:hypothetical protein